MTVAIKNAGSLAGHSSTDHLIDDSRCKDLIGQEFDNVAAALEAADQRCIVEGVGGRKHTTHPYTFVEVIHRDGSTSTHKSV